MEFRPQDECKLKPGELKAYFNAEYKDDKLTLASRIKIGRTVVEPPDMPRCSICGDAYIDHGNNADPFPGRCCTDCDNRFVIPARILGIGPDSAYIAVLTRIAQLGRALSFCPEHFTLRPSGTVEGTPSDPPDP